MYSETHKVHTRYTQGIHKVYTRWQFEPLRSLLWIGSIQLGGKTVCQKISVRLMDLIGKGNFSNGEEKRVDVKPYIGNGLFKELQDLSLFNSVKPCLGSIQWANGVDLFPDTLYLDSK